MVVKMLQELFTRGTPVGYFDPSFEQFDAFVTKLLDARETVHSTKNTSQSAQEFLLTSLIDIHKADLC